MIGYGSKIAVAAVAVLLIGTVTAPAAFAEGPTWYYVPYSPGYQGSPYCCPAPPQGIYPYPESPPSYTYSYPPYGYYYDPNYQAYYPDYQYLQSYPYPQPSVVVLGSATLPAYTPPAYAPPALPDPVHMPWGSFGTYENWVRAFWAEHGRMPTADDVELYWWSQAYAARYGHSPFNGTCYRPDC